MRTLGKGKERVKGKGENGTGDKNVARRRHKLKRMTMAHRNTTRGEVCPT
jgi:hypothetical protein